MLNIIFPEKSPWFANFQFDATLEDTFEASIELTRYPIESGVQVNDHRIINPKKWFITAAIGSQPLKPLISMDVSPEDFTGIAIGAATNLLRKNPLVAAVAGLSIGFLAGTEKSRASAALEYLMDLMRAGQPFFVDAVDIQLTNMVITKISRTRTPENEKGLVVVIEIQELVTLDRIKTVNGIEPSAEDLIESDPSQTSCSAAHYRGQQVNKDVVSTPVRQSVIQATELPPLT